MGNEVEVTEKEQKQETEDFEKIRQEIGAQIGEFF
jgi:predicted Co/Zn/Cd cation transporter (cation efflux family)